MLFSDITILDENYAVRNHCWVGTREGKIAYVSDVAPQVDEAKTYGEVYEGTNKLLMSGLYNAHAHAPMTLLRGYAESLPLQAWLYDKVFPFEAKIQDEDAYWATLLACAEMTRFGVVGFSDMYYFSKARIKAVAEAGMKMNLCDGILAFEEKPYTEYENFAISEGLIKEFHNTQDGRIKIDYNIHAEYTSNPLTIQGIVEAAQEKGLNIHLHASETKTEHEECKKRRGMTPIKYFDSLGVFESPTTAAHCVWVEDADIEILADKGVYVACNPASNMKLGSGFAPIPKMLKRGVNVALGTDGMASNNNNDMLQDMYLMALIYKGYKLDPTVVTPEQTLQAATLVGAQSQGRFDCGSLKIGNKADLCVLDTSGPSWAPALNPLYNLLYAGHGSDVCLTMIDGNIVYREGAWPNIDLEKAKAQTEAAAKRIIASL